VTRSYEEEPPGSVDSALEERARDGEPAARSELLTLSRGSLVAFCERYTSSLETAEDAAHDTLLAVSRSEAWPQGSFRAWLFRSARNRCLDLARRRPDGHAGAGAMTSYGPPRTGPGTAAARAEQHELLRVHLDRISPAKAEVIVLRYFEGLSRNEIAVVLGISEALVRSRLSAGRKELAELMDGES